MASKKKGNGARTINYVVDAITRCGCSTRAFFRKALPGQSGIDEQVKAFETLRARGLAATPQYSLPQAVMDLAFQAHVNPRPKDLFKGM